MTRRSGWIIVIVTCVVFSGAALMPPLHAQGGEPIRFAPDGAWCWFQDPRAAYVAATRVRTYATWVTSQGDLQIGAFDHRTAAVETYTLKREWGVDDHNVGSILVLPDHRLMVFYAQHNEAGLFCRRTARPEDITAWEDEVTITRMPRVTYSHPVYLSDERLFYVFWRGESWKPTFATSPDGIRWSDARILVQEPGRQGGDIRPYLKVVSDGRKSIHCAFTDGHPRDKALNSIYYVRYEQGAFTRADGTLLGRFNDLPLRPSACDRAYDARVTRVRGWVWDIALDSSGRPSIAYTRLPSEADHRYHVVRWNGRTWEDGKVTEAGKWFPQTPAGKTEFESHYSGGIVLHPFHPEIAYLSRSVNAGFRIEKWVQRSREWLRVSTVGDGGPLNVRPVVPAGYDGPDDHVLWMQGEYVHYTKFRTGIMMATPPAWRPDTNAMNAGARHWYTIKEDDHVIAPLPGQQRYPVTDAVAIADNILLFQKANGGWPKNYDMRAVLTPAQRRSVADARHILNTTFDNGATTSQCIVLAGAYRATGLQRFKEGFERGVDFILSAQTPTGGWPQFFPDTTGYRRYITFNDGAMIGVMSLLRRVARRDASLGIVDTLRARAAGVAVDRGIGCILRTQIRQQGVPTVWCQQHDDRDLLPRAARTFEPAALVSIESADIVRFLMESDDPGPDVIDAVDHAVAWFRRSSIRGIRVETVSAPELRTEWRTIAHDRVVVQDPSAGPLWARYYDLELNVPIFCGRDGRIVFSMAEVERERRAGYGWYSAAPQEILEYWERWKGRVRD